MRGAFQSTVGRVMRRPMALVAFAVLFVAIPVPLLPVEADVIFHVPEVLVRHAAVPRPVGTGTGTGRPVSRQNGSERWPDSEISQQGYQYFVEHAVSTADARKMALMLKLSEMPDSPPGCGKCTKREMEYCEANVMADHCCCERHFLPDPFLWLPHTCYIGPERCTPIANNCAHYARLRDCCCLKKLATQWKCILSQSPSVNVSGISAMVLSAIVVSLCL